ncbi:MAG: septal ring lytic transglycosylase RlpA family protein [Ignavibacteriota bacterium]|nr:septal ring lytic transglycosylase RlpA family protein [Ignavibacteriota bacterium]
MFRSFSAYLILALILVFLISGRDAVVFGQTSGSNSEYMEEGTASWYGPGFHGRKTANGERFNTNDLTCAHKSLPFNTLLKVTNLENGRYTIVRVNDRGPYAHGRIVDLSNAAKTEIGMGGLAKVRIESYKPVNSTDLTEVEDAMPLNLFEDAITKTSKVFIELNDRKLSSNNTRTNSKDEFRRILSTFKKVKVLVDKNNSILENIAPENGFDLTNFIELTDKIRTFTGHSIEVQSFSTEEEANKLIGKLEALRYNDLILVEIVSGDSINFKVFLGYYDKAEDADVDLRNIREMNFDSKVIKILS